MSVFNLLQNDLVYLFRQQKTEKENILGGFYFISTKH